MAASYPTAVKTFTTKNAGDTIQPGHLNDLQDEVAAIEGGLLNGTAPLNSSNSTVANLSVAGNSTIAGTLTVNKIVSTSITASGVTTYVRAGAGANPIEYGTASTGTLLAFADRQVDLSSEYDSTTYTFTPKSSGYYLIHASIFCVTAGALNNYLQLYVNDTLTAFAGAVYGAGQLGATPVIATVLNLSSGAAGSVQFRAYGGSTGRASSGSIYSWFDITRLF